MAILEEREGKEYDHFSQGYIEKKYHDRGSTVMTEKANIEVISEEIHGLTKKDRSFWDDLRASKEFSLYYPNRFEYFCGRALQGLLTGRSEKDTRKAVKRAIALAIEMEEALDSATD